jgi:hypothetical protein
MIVACINSWMDYRGIEPVTAPLDRYTGVGMCRAMVCWTVYQEVSISKVNYLLRLERDEKRERLRKEWERRIRKKREADNAKLEEILEEFEQVAKESHKEALHAAHRTVYMEMRWASIKKARIDQQINREYAKKTRAKKRAKNHPRRNKGSRCFR